MRLAKHLHAFRRLVIGVMGLLSIFVVAAVPVLKVLLVTALGSFLALERIDILGEEARRHLNNVVYFVFSPALVASCLMEAITMDNLATLWFMPVNVLLTFIIGSILALVLNKVARTPKHLRGLVIGCCAAGNLGSLLLIIIPAVCDESNSPFGSPSICNKHGHAYTSLSMAISVVYIWSYVYVLMRLSIQKSDRHLHGSDTAVSLTESSTDPLLPSTVSKDESFFRRVKLMFNHFQAEINLKMMFAPSTIAAIVGLVIGMVSPIRKALVGEGAALHVIESSTYLIGEAYVPSVTLILGANLLKGLKRSGVGLRIILGIMFIRFAALPLIGIGVVKGAQHLGLVGPDRLYQFVLMLQFAVPPAVAIGTITQLFEAGQNECSVVMLWTYAVSAFALTIWSAILMWLVS